MANVEMFEGIKNRVTGLPLQKIEVPEWGCTIHYYPTTPKETSIARAGIDEQKDPLVYYQVRLVNLKALDADGRRIFTTEQAKEMLDWPCLTVFSRIAAEMNKSVAVEEAAEDFISRPS